MSRNWNRTILLCIPCKCYKISPFFTNSNIIPKICLQFFCMYYMKRSKPPSEFWHYKDSIELFINWKDTNRVTFCGQLPSFYSHGAVRPCTSVSAAFSGSVYILKITDEWKNGGIILSKAEMLRGNLFQNRVHNKSLLICRGIEPEFPRKEAGDWLLIYGTRERPKLEPLLRYRINLLRRPVAQRNPQDHCC